MLQFARLGNNCILSWTHVWTTAQKMCSPHPVRVQFLQGLCPKVVGGWGHWAAVGSLWDVHERAEGWGGVAAAAAAAVNPSVPLSQATQCRLKSPNS